MSSPVLLPGGVTSGQQTTLGVMGGGQLGRMFVQAAQAMGYFTAVLDPDPASPAGLVSHYHIQTAYLDQQGLAQLMQRCAAITTEFENVPAPALLTLGSARSVAPAADAVAIAQDRAREKAHFVRCGVPCAPYAVIATAAQLAAVPDDLLPGILKTARLGYDGKGQLRVTTRAELASAWDSLKGVPCVLEKMLALKAECSVIVARGRDGCMVNLPLQLNLHRDGILAVTSVYEGNLPTALVAQAVAAARAIAEELHYVGVLCVEFFVLQDDSLIVNEMAPRPHNSGHYSLDACDLSQFDLQVRTLAGLPLVQPRQHSPAIMLNLLGDLWIDQSTPPWDRLLALPGAHLHLYGKLKASKGRKMGHLTLTGATPEQVRASALAAASILGIEAF
ncbi:MAG: 5-(carboxyamino)imidazole ribonucleotide synthase [Rhodoferax sp.]|uniref:5-(carboxyamino)imidazole ribonucleotide synthase n=1 Tax=Rhodoferax sp. TaxID=50421 RepID=UPI00262C9A81|nr:5-(carboxyamino)imidazole ribonucleotide synthase [Rhodoferax sp.]MDD5334252.1 5-(carboxyamino)imidazole ribonucleotide synthase [Rhodoferax sp.]